MKHTVMKRVFAVLLMVGMMVSCFAMASALDLTSLVPRGSNPPVTQPEEPTTTSNGTVGDAIKDIFIPSAPD
ncbi:MAG: hypothetical protein IJO82_08990, partial [Clostridia bacterium]|nr:hypothetical protein [Clostridia bacterium]